MKIAAQYPDVERLTLDLLQALIAPHEPGINVALGVPSDWGATSPEHLQIAWDGTAEGQHPVIAHATIRVTAWAHGATRAKAIAALAQALLLAHAGGAGITSITWLTGLLPAIDPATRADIASFTVRATVRAQPL